jgi:flagellar hook-basal body complex protein FliE
MIDALRIAPVTGAAGFSPIAKATAPSGVGDFAAQLADTLRAGENAVISGIKGDMPLQEVVETVMQAERTLTTTISIRDKVVSAYLEMTRMQI